MGSPNLCWNVYASAVHQIGNLGSDLQVSETLERRTVIKMPLRTVTIIRIRSQVYNSKMGILWGYIGEEISKCSFFFTYCIDCGIAHVHTSARPTWDSLVHPSPPPQRIPCKLAEKDPLLDLSLFRPTLHVRRTQSSSMTPS